MRIGLPRILSFYYLFPLYRVFLQELGVNYVETSGSTLKDLDKMKLCPTDEPCISIKIAFSHVHNLLSSHKVDAVFVPAVVSLSSDSYCCPKMIGLPHMLKAGLGLESHQLISPVIDFKDNPKGWRTSWYKAAKDLGVKDERKAIIALERGLKAWKESRGSVLSCGVWVPELVPSSKAESAEGLLNELFGPETTAIMGHAYILYDLFGKKLIEFTKTYGPVVVPEMIPEKPARIHLGTIFEGEKMWFIEGHILGASLYLLRNRKVGRMIFVSAFSCGPASIIENYIAQEAEKNDIPFLNLTVDEHTGEAGLITRLEAFMDSCKSRQKVQVSKQSAMKARISPIKDGGPYNAERRKSNELIAENNAVNPNKEIEIPGSPPRSPIGVVNMGNLNIPVRCLLEECGVDVRTAGELSDDIVNLGKELAPEFICYPMVTLLGQMRQLIDQGIDRILMIQGKGRCRLGWYAQVMQTILNRAGYPVKVLAVDSPFPWREKGQMFIDACKQIVGKPKSSMLARGASLALVKLWAIDKAQDILREVRAREEERGLGDRRYRKFLREMDKASGVLQALRVYARFTRDMREIRVSKQQPLKVAIVGEIYVVNEPFVNKDIEKILGSLEQRVRVYRRLDVTGWISYHLLKTPKAVWDHRVVTKAAERYIPLSVGGHGQESVGEAVLAKKRGMDGVIHLFPFTCMPEIIAQNILVKVSKDLDIPVLSLMISEQTGVAGFTTRLEAFCDLLEGRRKQKL